MKEFIVVHYIPYREGKRNYVILAFLVRMVIVTRQFHKGLGLNPAVITFQNHRETISFCAKSEVLEQWPKFEDM